MFFWYSQTTYIIKWKQGSGSLLNQLQEIYRWLIKQSFTLTIKSSTSSLSTFSKLQLSTGLCNMFTYPIQERHGCINPKMITHPSIHGLKTRLLCSLNKYALLLRARRGCFIVNCCSGLCLAIHDSSTHSSLLSSRDSEISSLWCLCRAYSRVHLLPLVYFIVTDTLSHI